MVEFTSENHVGRNRERLSQRSFQGSAQVPLSPWLSPAHLLSSCPCHSLTVHLKCHLCAGYLLGTRDTMFKKQIHNIHIHSCKMWPCLKMQRCDYSPSLMKTVPQTCQFLNFYNLGLLNAASRCSHSPRIQENVQLASDNAMTFPIPGHLHLPFVLQEISLSWYFMLGYLYI